MQLYVCILYLLEIIGALITENCFELAFSRLIVLCVCVSACVSVQAFKSTFGKGLSKNLEIKLS